MHAIPLYAALRAALCACAVAAPMIVTPMAFANGEARAGTSHLVETAMVYAPRAFSELCDRSPEICSSEKVADRINDMANAMGRMFGWTSLRFEPPVLTKRRMQTLKRVNTTVNATLRPRKDRYGEDRWELNALTGDCEEYVLMKREMLARLGWPRAALRIAVVKDRRQYHAVLVVETDRGGYVLDNQVKHLTTVADSPYEFVVAQSIMSPGSWVRVSKG